MSCPMMSVEITVLVPVPERGPSEPKGKPALPCHSLFWGSFFLGTLPCQFTPVFTLGRPHLGPHLIEIWEKRPSLPMLKRGKS